MKTLTATQKISKYLSLSVTALVAVIAMTGCGKKSNNNNLVNGGYGVGIPCSTACTGGNALLASTYSTSGVQFEDLYVYFTGVNATTGYQAGYQGQANVQGFMQVKSNSMATCNLAVGRYDLVPMQAGAIRGQSIVQSIYAQANGPTQIIMEFTPNMYMTSGTAVQNPFDGQQMAYRLNGTIRVYLPGGQPLRDCIFQVGPTAGY